MCFIKQENTVAVNDSPCSISVQKKDAALTVCKWLFMTALNGIRPYHQQEIVICASSTIDFTLCDCLALVHVLILCGSTTDPWMQHAIYCNLFYQVDFFQSHSNLWRVVQEGHLGTTSRPTVLLLCLQTRVIYNGHVVMLVVGESLCVASPIVLFCYYIYLCILLYILL